jgi:hypothetical protein
MRSLRSSLCLTLLSATAACTRPEAAARPSVRELEAPAAPGSGEPNLAKGADGRVFLSWIEPAGEGRHALRFATRAKGEPWSRPRSIAQGGGWFVNWADFPAVAALPDGALFAHWLARSGPGTYAYDVRVVVSRDGGEAWSAPVVPHRDGTRTEHGFVSMSPWTSDAMGLVWLDGRKTAGAGHEEHGPMTAEMSLVHATIARDGRLGDETILDGRVCDCCQTDAVLAGDTTVVVYRDRSASEVRDVSVVRFVEGRWTEPRPVAADGWEIKGCPVNGPAIAASGERVVAAWFTAPEGRARVKAAFSSDAGATFGPPIVVDDGRPIGRVDVVMAGERALVSWLEQGEKGAELRMRHVSADGSRGASLTVAATSAARSSGFPRLVAAGAEVIVAWRDGSEPPRVRTAVVSGAIP